tara:strand:+ start:92 stop:334 length:243 start_codon:yes stop_codon:yes gene_type:complete
MTKEKIIELYINDLESKVSASPARDSRIQMLKEELTEALNIASVDSQRELLPLCDRPDYKQGWADCLDVNDLDTAGNKRQ